MSHEDVKMGGVLGMDKAEATVVVLCGNTIVFVASVATPCIWHLKNYDGSPYQTSLLQQNRVSFRSQCHLDELLR